MAGEEEVKEESDIEEDPNPMYVCPLSQKENALK